MKLFKIFNNEYLRSLIKINDFIIKLVCIILAVMLWAMVTSQNIETIEIPVTITPVNLPAEYVISAMQKKTAVVKIMGNKEVIKTVTRKMVNVEVDLKNPIIGKAQKYDLILNKTEEAASLQFDLKDDKTVITIEKKVSKIVPVKVAVAGKGANGMIPVQFKAIPQMVTVSGPESVISHLPAVETEPIMLNTRNNSFRQQMKLKMISGEGISYDTLSVMAFVNIAQADSVVALKPKIVLKNELDQFEYSVINGQVNVFVRKDIVPDSLHAEQVELIADLSLIDQRSFELLFNGEGVVSCPVRLYSPRNPAIELGTIIPEYVSIKIKMKEK